jgi:transcriptional regulator with GAF, ATPase, and Fis domain
MRAVSSSEREVLWLRKVRDVSQVLAREHDLEQLLPRILDAAIEITSAERGFLVRVQRGGGDLRVHVEVARGFNQSELQSSATSVSRTVVERVMEQGAGLVTTREQDASVLDASSVMARRVLAICCVPLRLRDEVQGVLYLDHRFRPDAFSEDDLPVLAVFADQAALAIETAELRADSARLTDSLRELEELRAQEEQPAERSPQRRPPLFGRLVGASPPMCELYTAIERSARSRDPVLILGESGAGKQLVARELHARGELPNQPFLEQVCAAAAEADLERELFGERSRVGALARAERGTLLLIEVADLPPTLQGRLAATLRERMIRPTGGGRPQRLACRVTATSTRDLREEVEAGRFREDLYYRLDVQRLEIPPLRQRRDDFAVLLDHFARVHGEATCASSRTRSAACSASTPSGSARASCPPRSAKAEACPRRAEPSQGEPWRRWRRK